MKISVGSDHGGFALKETMKAFLSDKGAEVLDRGCYSDKACDYPDFASEVAKDIMDSSAEHGLLICTTGIGMSMAANKYPGVRAALCVSPDMAEMSRQHNHANVLILGAKYTSEEDAKKILDAWLAATVSPEARHSRRVNKLTLRSGFAAEIEAVRNEDPDIYASIRDEVKHQNETINLIASENNVSPAVRAAQGCVMTNKYAEGYPGKRYYNGCDFVDQAERLAISRALELFGADHANVQPHCGSSANMAVYFSALNPGDTILAMSLAHGGHLTHGHTVNFSGRLFKFVHYGVSKESERIDYDEVATLAKEHKPAMIVCGASAYPRALDFPRFKEIADTVGALLMVDMAHIAGLVAAKVHPDPVPYSDFVTTTTHKTLRGPRSGMVLCKNKFAVDLDKTIFPGLQGGPLMHTIAAKAVCFMEALKPEFKTYSKSIITNAAAMADEFTSSGIRMVSGGTDNHLMLLDATSLNLTGKDAALMLDKAGIIVNKNAIPFDTKSPFVTSGIRLGTPSITTRGMGVDEARAIARMIIRILKAPQDTALHTRVAQEVKELALLHPQR